MKISLGTRIPLDELGRHNGFGYATDRMVNSLQDLGYHIEENDSSAEVEIWFEQPHHWKFSPNTYKIGYLPWESTKLLPGWADIMNDCDEIWTPSPLIAEWFKKYNGIRVPVFIYEHGVDHVWAPKRRTAGEPIKFLHIGAEAARKGGWSPTIPLFRKAFAGYRKDVSLTMKMIKSKWNSIDNLGRVRYINEKYDFAQLQDLYYDHHVYVYPSYGEGFGLTPLQAMATGMPTITLPGWAPYSDFLDPNLSIGHTMAASSWPKIHPGKMMRPSSDDLVDAYRYAADHYDDALDFAMRQTDGIHKKYDWNSITHEVFSALEMRLESR